VAHVTCAIWEACRFPVVDRIETRTFVIIGAIGFAVVGMQGLRRFQTSQGVKCSECCRTVPRRQR